MKTYERTVTTERAKELKHIFSNNPEWFFIPTIGSARVKPGQYRYKVIFYSWIGGNEWSQARKMEQFRMYYN